MKLKLPLSADELNLKDSEHWYAARECKIVDLLRRWSSPSWSLGGYPQFIGEQEGDWLDPDQVPSSVQTLHAK